MTFRHKTATALLQRARWLGQASERDSALTQLGWPDLSEGAMLESADSWLGPWLQGARSMADLKALDWTGILRCGFGHGLNMCCCLQGQWASPVRQQMNVIRL